MKSESKIKGIMDQFNFSESSTENNEFLTNFNMSFSGDEDNINS